MRKYCYVCPDCGTEFELRKRVTITRRRCSHCNLEIRTSEIDSQIAQKERELEEDQRRREFVEKEVGKGQAKYNCAIEITQFVVVIAVLCGVTPLAGICTHPVLVLKISAVCFTNAIACLPILIWLTRVMTARRPALEEAASLKFSAIQKLAQSEPPINSHKQKGESDSDDYKSVSSPTTDTTLAELKGALAEGKV